MTNNNINPYKQIGVDSKTARRNIRQKINFFEITECILAFFLNKICLFSALSPFGIAYFAATFPMQDMSFGVIAAFLGIIFMGLGVTSLKYVGTLSVYLIFTLLYNKDLSEKKWLCGAAAALSLFASGMVFVVFDGLLMYDILMLVLESILVFVSYLAFDKASLLIRGIKSRKVFDPLEAFSLVALFSVFILSLSLIPNLEGAVHVLSTAVILLISVSSGFGLSAAAGATLGLVCSITSVLPAQVICTYTLSALAAGMLRRYGKVGVSSGFLLTNAVVMIYLNSSSVTIIHFIYILIATLILFLMPQSLILRFGEFVKSPTKSTTLDPSSRIIEMISENLDSVSTSFSDLSEVFSSLISDHIETDIKSAGLIFDNTADTVCRNCNLCVYCWHKNYEETASMLSDMFQNMSKRGFAVEFDAPCNFRSQCIKFDDFLDTLNKNYEIHKVNIMWASRVHESRSLLPEQFKNISSVLTNVKARLQNGFECDEKLERKISVELDKKGIAADNIRVNYTDYYEVSMTTESCSGTMVCVNTIAAAVSGVLGVPVFRTDRVCGSGKCKLKFREKARFSTDVGFAKIAGNCGEESGDSHVFIPIPDGKYVLALSDGMGRGKNANSQSKITIELIKKLLYSGFDKETALRLINTILLFKTQTETFATADICILNLFTGAVEFIKTGAVNSYIKSGDRISTIKCSSLPAGALTTLDADCELTYAKDGDYIIMVTDGISDLLDSPDNDILKDIIKNFSGQSSQSLADEIIKAAIKQGFNTNPDDMTVLVARINEEQ